MNVWFAPLEGTTDAIFRRVHHQCFSGVEKYFIPFVSPTQNMVFTARELSGIAPEVNEGVPVVPQLLGKHAGHVLWAVRELQSMGYTEVNLNLGCPSGTVTAKGKGSGLLREPEALERFLDELFAGTTLPISIKTRIGFASEEEWPALLELLARYPAKELIIHPRTRADFYKGPIHPEAYALVCARATQPLVYNGDLFTAEDCRRLMAAYPNTVAVMAGRGLIANPAMAQELNGGEKISVAALREFHDRLCDAYAQRYQQDQVHRRVREVMKYVCCCFEGAHKPLKAIRKAADLRAHREAVDWLLRDFDLREESGYLPQMWTG